MIRGIGIDLLETERIRAALERPGFREKYYTVAELALSPRQLAKAFGFGFRYFGPAEIEVLRDAAGKPYIRLYGRARKMALRLRIKKVHVSLTDTGRHIMAAAVMER